MSVIIAIIRLRNIGIYFKRDFLAIRNIGYSILEHCVVGCSAVNRDSDNYLGRTGCTFTVGVDACVSAYISASRAYTIRPSMCTFVTANSTYAVLVRPIVSATAIAVNHQIINICCICRVIWICVYGFTLIRTFKQNVCIVAYGESTGSKRSLPLYGNVFTLCSRCDAKIAETYKTVAGIQNVYASAVFKLCSTRKHRVRSRAFDLCHIGCRASKQISA